MRFGQLAYIKIAAVKTTQTMCFTVSPERLVVRSTVQNTLFVSSCSCKLSWSYLDTQQGPGNRASLPLLSSFHVCNVLSTAVTVRRCTDMCAVPAVLRGSGPFLTYIHTYYVQIVWYVVCTHAGMYVINYLVLSV